MFCHFISPSQIYELIISSLVDQGLAKLPSQRFGQIG